MDPQTSFEGKRVLIAEDDEVNRELMTDVMAFLHCAADMAKDGQEAIEKYKTNSYDLILMDIRMPVKDGIEATKEIRSLEKAPKRIPIIALTATTDPEDREKAVQAGIDDFVSKPIELKLLREKMQKYLQVRTGT